MSDDAPRAPDRPRLAEALASLKEGLQDSADPFFDGWKRPRAPAEVQANVSAVARSVAEAQEQRPVADALDTELASLPTDVTLHALDTEISDHPPFGAPLEAEAQFPPRDELDAPTHEMAKVQIARAPRAVDVASPRSPLPETVRVHVIRYPVFPRWALVAAAALLVFAASVVGLRLAYPTPARAVVLVAAPQAETALGATAAAPSEPEVPPLAPVADPAAAGPSAGLGSASSPGGGPGTRERHVKPREGKAHAPGFFREPGF